MSSKMGFSYDSRPIQTITNQIKNSTRRDGIDLQPQYQRGYIWKNDFKDKLIYSIVRNYPIGNISIRVRQSPNDKGAMQEVVDGQQRLTTVYKFMSGDYFVTGEYSRNILEYIIDYLDGESDIKLDKLRKRIRGRGKLTLKYDQLPDAIKENIQAYNISITNITNSTDKEISEYFRYLQNQEILRAGEIITSMPDTALQKYFALIEDKDLFLEKMGYSDERKQFERIFYSILGLLDGAISFGTVDKKVLNYVAESGDLSATAKNKCEIMIRQINHIANESPVKLIRSNTRSMKFFLLLSSLSLVDFETDTNRKLNHLHSINQMLSSFSSAKADKIEQSFMGYSDAVIEEFRLIALISRGGHSFRRVENRMHILAYYVNDFSNKTRPSGIRPI